MAATRNLLGRAGLKELAGCEGQAGTGLAGEGRSRGRERRRGHEGRAGKDKSGARKVERQLGDLAREGRGPRQTREARGRLPAR